MLVDDETLEKAAAAHSEYFGGPWDREQAGVKPARREAMRKALATLPEREAAACPTREELAQALYEEWSPVQPAGARSVPWLRVADRALALCAGRVPAEVWGLVERWRDVANQSHLTGAYCTGRRDAAGMCADELEAALKSLPQPASPPDALPVPGAAVRALRDNWLAYDLGTVDRKFGEDLRDALRADQLAIELPNAAKLGDMLREAWDEPQAGDRWLSVGSRALDMLRQHAAPKPVACATEAARRILSGLTGGDAVLFPAEALAARTSAELGGKTAADEAEALRWRRAVERPLGEDDCSSHTPEWAEDLLIVRCSEQADLESRLAAATEKHAKLLAELRLKVRDKDAVERERDEALAKLAEAEQEIEDLGVKLSDAEGHAPDGETVEALTAKLEAEKSARLAAMGEANRFSVELGAALARLAARPDPVVIDETLARRVEEAYWGAGEGDAMPGLGRLGIARDSMLRALRAKFGTRASVSVPQGDVAARARHDQLLADNAVLGVERDQLRAELDESKRLVDVRTEVMKRELARANSLDAELKRTIEAANENYAEAVADGQKLRAELEQARKRNRYDDQREEQWLEATDCESPGDAERVLTRLRSEADELRRKLQEAFDEDVESGHASIQREKSLRAEVERMKAELGTARRGVVNRDSSIRLIEDARDRYASELAREQTLNREAHEHVDQLKAELEAANKQLHARSGECCRLNDRLDELGEQYEALRAACVMWPSEIESAGFLPHQHSPECAPLQTLQSYACRVERALLKPAPAEAEPAVVSFQADRPLMESVEQPSPEPTLRERVERLERDTWERLAHVDGHFRAFLQAWSEGSCNKAVAAAVLEHMQKASKALDERKGST